MAYVDSETSESTDDELHYYHQDLQNMSSFAKKFEKYRISTKYIISFRNKFKVRWD